MNDANEQTHNPHADPEAAPQAQTTPPQVDPLQVPPKNTHCVNHPEKAAFRVCKMCARAFCPMCLTHHMGIYYCDECRKTIANAINSENKESEEIVAHFHRKASANDIPDYAQRAFKWALIGLIPGAGIVISLIALILGFSAMSHPSLLPGKKNSQKAMYAVIISAGSFIVQIIIGLILVITLGG